MALAMMLKPFDTLVDEARAEGLLRHSGELRAAAAGARVRPPLLTIGSSSPGGFDACARRRRLALPVSMLLHAAATVAVVVVPLLIVDTLPRETAGVKAFFAEPIALPPPPPPPPPAPARAEASVRAPRPVATRAVGFVAPIEVPAEIKPEEGLALGVEGGVPGGVEGGVPGGVVGGVVGGLPDAPPPPPVLRPVRVGGEIRAPRKIVDVAAVYPPLAVKAQLEGIVVIEATIDPRGHVVNATVLRGMPLLDGAALDAVRQWVYTPTLLNGVPTPIIMTVTVTFRLQHSGPA
jgi:protein TonB